MIFDYSAIQKLDRLNYQVNCLIKDFCCRAKRCFGISATGNPNLVLNQQGEWISPGGGSGDIQTLLSNLTPYNDESEAINDGKGQGYWWFDQVNKVAKRIWNFISNYTAGRSTIDFTNNGGDDWTIGFKITPTSTQLPIGYNIVDYSATVSFWILGIDNSNDFNNQTTDITVNKVGLGAGVYQMAQRYSATNGVDTKVFLVTKLVKVDAIGNIIAQIDIEGITVNSVNGLIVNATLNINQVGCNYTIQWAALDNSYSLVATFGNNLTETMALPSNAIYLSVSPQLDSVFTTDFTSQSGALSTISIQ